MQSLVARDLDEQIEAAQNTKKYDYLVNIHGMKKNTITWIDKLLDTPLDDYRKYTIKFILAPYLMNVRGLSRTDAFDAISMWLNRCDSVCKLRFDINHKINEALDMVGDYLPQGRGKLKQELTLLYTRLEEEGIVY